MGRPKSLAAPRSVLNHVPDAILELTVVQDPPAPRLEIQAGARLERLSCSLCGDAVALTVIPPIPEPPIELKALMRPILRYATRKAPELRRAFDCLLAGDVGGMFKALRESEQISTLVPVVCPRCIGADPRLLEAGQ